MKQLFAISLLLCCIQMYAQQPPAQLPRLIEQAPEELPGINESPEAFIKKNVFVKVEAGSNTVYTGEPLLVTYKLYTCLNSKSRVSKQPVFNGCSVLELASESEPQVATVQGREFHIYTIRKIQVIPLEEGELKLEPLYVDNIIPLAPDGLHVENFSFTAGNIPLTIQVLPLPAEGRPKNFSGIVGSFDIRAAADSNSVPVGENATLRITIHGQGNVAGIHIPPVHWPQGTEHFDASDTQHIDQENYPVTGYKTFNVPFIGSKEGQADIPPIAFNFFDPVKKAYRTIVSAGIPIIFTPAGTHSQQMQAAVQEGVGNSKYLWIVGSIALVVITILFITAYRSKKPRPVPQLLQKDPVEPIIPAKNMGLEILSELNKLDAVQDEKKFLASACSLLTHVLVKRFSASHTDSHELVTVLRQSETDADIAAACANIFADCNRNLYSPGAEEGIKEKVYFELSAVIKKLYPV